MKMKSALLVGCWLALITLASRLSVANAFDRSQCRCRSTVQPRIHGGENLQANRFPWHVSIGRLLFNRSFLESDEYQQHGLEYREQVDEELQLNSHYCGGTILNERWVLTAAHCQPTEPSGVGVGSFVPDIFVDGRIPIKRFIVHPQYGQPSEHSNDVALVELQRPLLLDEWTQPGCIAAGVPERQLRRHPLLAIGFGSEQPVFTLLGEHGERTELAKFNAYSLKQVQMVKTAERFPVCREPAVLCARGLHYSHSICSGDSGGPLHLTVDGHSLVVGVTSRGNLVQNHVSKMLVDCTDMATFALADRYHAFIQAHVPIDQYCPVDVRRRFQKP